MFGRYAAACAAVLALLSAARAQPELPLKELPPIAGDPFTDPIFQPTDSTKAKPLLPPPSLSLYDAATANDPFAVPSTDAGLPDRAADACSCVPGFTTWLIAEWLIGRTRAPSLVPIVTTGPASAGVLAGAIGQPTTLPLFGGRPILNDWRSGLRVGAGVWLDDGHRTGISGRFYSLFSANESFVARPTGTTVINLPQFTPLGPLTLQTPLFVSFPGVTRGSVTATTRTTFSGGDLNARWLLDRGERYRVEFLAGYRQMYLGDSLGTAFTLAPTATIPIVSPSAFGGDNIRTRNDFYGPQLGLYASTGWNRLTLEGNLATAMGASVSELDFTRTRDVAVGAAGGPVQTTAALVALGLPPATAAALTPAVLAAANNQVPLVRTGASNTLTYFGVVAEGGLRMNWRATDHLRLTAGYSFLYWNSVRRAEEMFLNGPVLRPRAIDFSTHLFSVGLDVRY